MSNALGELVPASHTDSAAGWSLNDIPYARIDRGLVATDRQLFFQIAAASFIEITSDLYTRNLVQCFDGDEEVGDWLRCHWEPEELQHGVALKRYVRTAWPEFDWEAAYRGFYDEYAATCQLEVLAPTRTQELVARCVVEMGTATGYRLLRSISPEPVLAQLAGRIQADEVRHYKYFYRFFRRYRELENIGRLPVLRTLYGRLGTISGEDAYYAFKHVFMAAAPQRPFAMEEYRSFRRRCFRQAREYYPYRMGIKMLLKPLDLNPAAQRATIPALSAAIRHILLR